MRVRYTNNSLRVKYVLYLTYERAKLIKNNKQARQESK